MNCKKCGNMLAEGDLFCSYCGTSAAFVAPKDLVDSQVNMLNQSAVCPMCSFTNKAEDRFCANCGSALITTKKHTSKHLLRRIIGIASIAVCLALVAVGIFSLLGKVSSGKEGHGNESVKNDAPLPTFDTQMSFQEQTLIEAADYRVTALALEISEWNHDSNLQLSMLYENYTDEELFFRTEIKSVNQYAVGEYEVPTIVNANDKVQDCTSIHIWDGMDKAGLLELGIRNIYEIEVYCTISDSESPWGSDLYEKTFVFTLNDPPAVKEDCFLEGLRDGSYAALTEKTIEHISTEGNGQVGDLDLAMIALMNGNQGNELCIEFRNTGTQKIRYEVSDIEINGLLLAATPTSYAPHDSGSISAGKYGVSQTIIEPDELLKDCFGITEIGTVSFTVSAGKAEKRITFQIPGRGSTLDVSGQTIYDRNGIRIVFKGVYWRTETYMKLELDEHYETIETIERTEDVYEMVVYVENTAGEDVNIELDADSLFFNYKKTAFASLGNNKLGNYGYSPAGYSGYMLLTLDSDSMKNNGFRDPSAITDVEAVIVVDGLYIEDMTTARFSIE